MITLDGTSELIELVLGGVVTSTQLDFTSNYVDISQSTFALSAVSNNNGTSNDTTDVTVVGSPGASTSRQVKYISIYNSDTAAADVTVKFNTGAADRIIGIWTLSVGDTLEYVDGKGWNVLDSTGSIKRVNANSQPLDGNLTAIAGLTSAADKLPYFTGSETASLADLTSVARTLLAQATQALMRTTGLGYASGGMLESNVSSSNGQLAFPATQNASADANTLDDYEEGTWTPSLLFGGGNTGLTYTVQVGQYRKFGSHVHLWGVILLSAKGSSTGSATISGIPFTAGTFTNGQFSVPMVTSVLNLSASYYGPYQRIDTAASAIEILEQGDNVPIQALTEAAFANNTTLLINISYTSSS